MPPVWQPFEYEHIHLFCRNVIVLATDRLLSLARTSPLSQATPPLVSSPTVERSVDVQMAMVPDLLADDDLPPPIPWIHVRHWRRNPRLSLEPISPRLIWSTNNTAVDHKADQPSHWALDQVIGPVGPFGKAQINGPIFGEGLVSLVDQPPSNCSSSPRLSMDCEQLPTSPAKKGKSPMSGDGRTSEVVR